MQIVGVLSGGAGGCDEGFPSLYGKFSRAWNWEMEANRRAIDWLDPDYTGTLVIDGIYEALPLLPGDINFDDTVNVLDIILLVNMIMINDYTENADLNDDLNLNVLDIISIVIIILDT